MTLQRVTLSMTIITEKAVRSRCESTCAKSNKTNFFSTSSVTQDNQKEHEALVLSLLAVGGGTANEPAPWQREANNV